MNFLDGIRVLDTSRVLAGPFAGQILADMGADVLKIEPPNGDETRSWGPPFKNGMSAYFDSCNRNKTALTLDLKESQAREQLLKLVGHCDIWIDNFPADVKKRLGLHDELLFDIQPTLIRATVCSYPADSPMAGRRGYDLVLQAETGYMGTIGPVSGEPYKVGHAVIDVMTGMMTANAVLAALVRRLRVGGGACVDVSLYQTALFSLVNLASNFLQSGQQSPRHGNAHPNIVPYEAFPSQNGTLVIGVGNDRQFQQLIELFGLPQDWSEMKNSDRIARRDHIVATISQATLSWDLDELLMALRERHIPAAPILRPDQALSFCRAHIPSALVAVQREAATVETVANPIMSSGMRQQHSAPPGTNQGGHETMHRWLAR